MSDETAVYRKAPTFLYHREKEARLFHTQEAVDAAWAEGWFGPPWLDKASDLLGEKDFDETFRTKAGLVKAAAEDHRYKGLTLNARKSVDDLMSDVIAFEIVNGMRESDGE